MLVNAIAIMTRSQTNCVRKALDYQKDIHPTGKIVLVVSRI